MRIAIDESGDTGRKFWAGSSGWFILTAVIVPDSMVCGPTCQAVDEFRFAQEGGRELHFSHNSHQQHVRFFEHMKDKDFVFASVCIDKRKLIKSRPFVFRSKMTLLRFGLEELFNNLQPWLDHPVVLIDRNGSKHFNRALGRHLLRLFGSRHRGDNRSIEYVQSVDSSDEPLVQLADYIAGAVHHHIDGEHPNSHTFELYLQNKGKIFFIE
jgi:Protein of unknown function (DUF3800)